MIYCDLITLQFVSHSKIRFLRTFIPLEPSAMTLFTPQPSVTKSLKTRITYRWKSEHYESLIVIIDTAGKPIPFPDSKKPAKVVLHFRRVLQ